MMRSSQALTLTCLGVFLWAAAAPVSPRVFAREQSRANRPAPERAADSAQAAEVAQSVSAARVLRDAGKLADALSATAAVLKKYPANSEAAQFHIDTQLLADRFSDALVTYDRYIAARQRPDVQLLGDLARADLRRTVRVKTDDPTVVALALERLALDGDAGARQALRQMSDASRGAKFEDLAPTISLARLKDAEAEGKLGEWLRVAPAEQRPAAIQAIRDAGAKSQAPQIIAVLGESNVGVRGAAILALGALQAKEAVPHLQAAFNDGTGAIKAFAAVALKQLGQPTADPFLAELLNSPVAEIRLMAASGFRYSTVRGQSWNKAVAALMSGPNELYRVQAAEMIACCDLPGAKTILSSGLGSQNPLLRAEAGKVFESHKELADAVIARRILGDPVEFVRVYGSGLTLALRRGGTAPARGAARPE